MNGSDKNSSTAFIGPALYGEGHALLRRRENDLLAAQEAAGIGLWDWDLRSGEILWSPGMFRILGIDPRTPSSERYDAWLKVLHPDDRAGVPDEETRRKTAAPGPFAHEFRLVRLDGEVRWVLAQGEVSADAAGPARMLGLNIDITDRKRAEAALRESEARFRALNDQLEREAQRRARQLAESRARLEAFFDASLDWLSLLRAEPNGSFVYVDLNPACQNAYGLPREQVIGRRMRDVLGREQAEAQLRHVRECVRTGQPQRYRARSVIGGKQRTIDVMFVPVPLETETGEHLIAVTAHDLTEREELEAQLRQAQKLDALGQLTGGIAHDFNNLLAAILGSLELAKRRVTDARTLKLLNTATRAGERGANLTAQMLAFSRKQELSIRPVDANAVIRRMQDLLERTLHPSISVRLDLDPELWLAMADPVQLEVVLLNLALNARDAMPLGGKLWFISRNATISTQAQAGAALTPGDYIILSVRDTGEGMSEEVRAKAFEPFFTTKGPGKGSGLGLAQVFGFARQAGGAATIESAPGLGTTVSIYLPKSEALLAMPAEPDENSPTPSPAERLRLLLADDDEAVRQLARDMLDDSGHDVTAVGSGVEVLRLLAGPDPFDLLLLDFAMPGMNGSEVALAARQLRPDLPILFMTGYADTDALKPWLRQGCRMLNKPFRAEELVRAVSEAARRNGSRGSAGKAHPLNC